MRFLIIALIVLLSAVPVLADNHTTCGDRICHADESVVLCPFDCAVFNANLPLDQLRIVRGENITQTLQIRQYVNTSRSYTFTALEALDQYITFSPETLVTDREGLYGVNVTASIPQTALVREVSGSIVVTSGESERTINMFLEALEQSQSGIIVRSKTLTDTIRVGEDLVYLLTVNFASTRDEGAIVASVLESAETGLQVPLETITMPWGPTYSQTRSTPITADQLRQLSNGSSLDGVYLHIIEVDDAEHISVITVSLPFWQTTWFRWLLIFIGSLPVVYGAYYAQKKYRAWRDEKRRYVLPNLHDLPGPHQDGTIFKVGFLGESKIPGYMQSRDFTTHALVAGSTGSGKSVTASVIVEEALNAGIPAVIFDPTSQWTGFLSRLKDDAILKMYKKYSMTDDDTRSYRGLIFTPKDDKFELDIDEYLHPGEVTVFNLAHLSTIEYDRATEKIIKSLFDKHWEETGELRLLVIFDEVHRLLDPSCEGLGYRALIKACREFRKWGLGLIMASQVSSDFKEAIGGNVLTEVQLNTKNLNDIHKVEEKYGAEFAKRVTRQGVGVGLVQNPKYNAGKPWFIQFRPPLHNPHKLSEEDLELYNRYTAQIKDLSARIAALGKAGTDVSDLELDLNLANSKLKEGKFKMVEIYLQGIAERVDGDQAGGSS